MQITGWVRGAWMVTRCVLRDFRRNKGLLLAGAIAYNALLSMLPLIAVLFALTAFFFDRTLLVSIVNDELNLMAPGAAGFAEDVGALWENRDLIGGVGGIVLLFFSSFAFRAIEESFAIIFAHAPARRHFWVSALLPLLFILLLMGGLLIITGATMLMETAAAHGVQLLGHRWNIPDASAQILSYGGFLGLVVLFAAIYWIMPAAKVSPRRALIGGLIAAVLWEVVRRTIVWYFANVSMVNTIYGSAATIVVLLLSFEAAAIILLLGAQFIAELEKIDNEDGSGPIVGH